MAELKENPLELGPEFKALLKRLGVYLAVGVLGAITGANLPGEPPLHPAAAQAIEEIPPRVIVVERNGPYSILLDQATGVQFLRTPSGVCAIPGTPAPVVAPQTLEELFKQ